MSKLRITDILVLCFVVVLCESCGSSSTSTASNTVNTGTAAIQQTPAIDPSTADSSQTSSSSINADLSLFVESLESRTLDILVTQTAPTGSSEAGLVEMFQCASDSQDQYVSVSADNTSSDTVQYTVTMKSRNSFGGDVDVTFVGDTDGEGSIKSSGSRSLTVNGSNSTTDFSVSFTSDGTTNTFAATDGSNNIICAWNSDGNGCGKVGSGDSVPYSFSTGTDGERTYSTGTDTSLCDSLPTAITTVTSVESFTGDETYDCGVPSDCTTVTPESAVSLEDNGGTQCQELGGHWADASADPSSCSDTTTASGIGCYCDSLYALTTQMVKSGSRSGLCKVMGLANNGDVNLGERTSSGSVCIQDLVIGGDDDD